MTRKAIFLISLCVFSLSSTPLLAAGGLIFDGDFESGTFQGWTPGGENGGFVTIAAKSGCYSFNDTTGITFNRDPTSNYAALLRSGSSGSTGSIAILRSDAFEAGSGITFSALSETIGGVPNPSTLTIRILDSSDTELVSIDLDTALINLSEGCPSAKRDAAFSGHFVDTHQLSGPIKVEFRQHTNREGLGLFTLIDNVSSLAINQLLPFTSRPVAVAGTSVTTSGTLYLDPTRSFDPDNKPSELDYSWFVDDTDNFLELDLPCINLNDDNTLSAGNHIATLYVNDGMHAVADTLNFVVPESDSDSETDTETDTETDSESDSGSSGSGSPTLTDPRNECDVDVTEKAPGEEDDEEDGGGEPGDGVILPIILNLDLDADNSDSNNNAIGFVTGNSAALLTDNVEITDAANDLVRSVSLSIISGKQSEDKLSLKDGFTSTVIDVDSAETTDGGLVLQLLSESSSDADISFFEAAIEATQFETTSSSETNRVVLVTLIDSNGSADTASVFISVSSP